MEHTPIGGEEATREWRRAGATGHVERADLSSSATRQLSFAQTSPGQSDAEFRSLAKGMPRRETIEENCNEVGSSTSATGELMEERVVWVW